MREDGPVDAGASRVGRRLTHGAALLATALLVLAAGVVGSAPGSAAAAALRSGPRIVFANRSVLHSVTPAGAAVPLFGRFGGPTTIHGSPETPDIAVSRDGDRVAVLQRTGTDGAHGDYFRVVLHSRGAHRQRQVWSYGPIEEAGAPSVALSPDGRLLAISIWRRILIQNLNTGHRRFLATPEGFYDIQPSFTADGRHLVFCRGEQPEKHWEKPADIYERALVGGDLRRLTHTGRQEFFPTLSSDGRHLAFMRRLHGHYFVLVVAARDDSDERILHGANNLLTRPDFSPDGERVAFSWVKSTEYVPDPLFSVLTVGIDGTDPRTVLRAHGSLLYPQWVEAP